MIAGSMFGSLREQLARAAPTSNVLRSIDFVTAGGDASSRPEMRDAFVQSEALTKEQITSPGRVDFTRSPGPIADRFLMSADPVAVIVGPRGSAKTTTLFKKVAYEGQGIRPGPDGMRRYVCSAWREKYVNIWDATIATWWKLYPADMAGSKWNGSKPHPATHLINFRDEFGPIEITMRFRAFGETADSDDTLGNEGTDCLLNQIETLPENLFTWLGAVIGRDPPRQLLYPNASDDFVYGKIYGDMNSPEPLSWLYRDFYETPKPHYRLYRQPGGLEPEAENIHVVGRGYYHNLVRINAHRKWWVRINVHNQPAFRMDADSPYATEDADYLWDDEVMVAKETIPVERSLPVVVGIDGGFTPAAVYTQVVSSQARILAEVPLQRGGMKELSERMLELEAKRFQGCEFADRCDPSMLAGEETEDRSGVQEKSDRQRLSEYLARDVLPAQTNNPDRRWQAVRDKMVVSGGRPLLLLDPSCKVARRGFNGAYRFHRVAGTNDRGNIRKDFTSHTHDGIQAAALEWGGDAARRRRTDLDQQRRARQAEAASKGRYRPLARWRRG